MKYENLISEILSGTMPEENLPKLEKQYPGIIKEFGHTKKKFKKSLMLNEIQVDEYYFENLLNIITAKKEKYLRIRRISFAGFSLTSAIAILMIIFIGSPKISNKSIFSGNESEFNVLADDDIYNSIESEILSENQVISELLPDSLVTNYEFENVKSSSLIEYLFANSQWDNDIELLAAENELADASY